MESKYSCTLTSNSPEVKKEKKEKENRESLDHLLKAEPLFQLQLVTSQSLPVELSLLDEPSKHLSLHEDLQEAADGLGRDRFTKTLMLKGAGDRGGGGGRVAVFPFPGDEEWIVAYQLDEEANKGLGHNGAKLV